MDDLYVIVSSAPKLDESEPRPPTDCMKFLADKESLSETYGSLLEECFNSYDGNRAPDTHSTLFDMFMEQDNVGYAVLLFNRKTRVASRKSLDEFICDTAGPSIYEQEHEIDGRRETLKTLEMYLTREEFGGNAS